MTLATETVVPTAPKITPAIPHFALPVAEVTPAVETMVLAEPKLTPVAYFTSPTVELTPTAEKMVPKEPEVIPPVPQTASPVTEKTLVEETVTRKVTEVTPVPHFTQIMPNSETLVQTEPEIIPLVTHLASPVAEKAPTVEVMVQREPEVAPPVAQEEIQSLSQSLPPLAGYFKPGTEIMLPGTEKTSPVNEPFLPAAEDVNPVDELTQLGEDVMPLAAEVVAPIDKGWQPMAGTLYPGEWKQPDVSSLPVVQAVPPGVEAVPPVVEIAPLVVERRQPVDEMAVPVAGVRAPVLEITPSGIKDVTLVAQSVPQVAQVVPSAVQAGPPVAQAVTPVIQDVPFVSQAEPPVAQAVPSVDREVPRVAQRVPLGIQAVPLANQPVPSVPQAGSPISVQPAVQAMPSVDQAVPPVAEAVLPVAQAVAPVFQSVPSVAQAEPLEDQAVPSVDEAVPSVTQAVASVIQAVPIIDQPISSGAQNIPPVVQAQAGPPTAQTVLSVVEPIPQVTLTKLAAANVMESKGEAVSSMPYVPTSVFVALEPKAETTMKAAPAGETDKEVGVTAGASKVVAEAVALGERTDKAPDETTVEGLIHDRVADVTEEEIARVEAEGEITERLVPERVATEVIAAKAEEVVAGGVPAGIVSRLPALGETKQVVAEVPLETMPDMLTFVTRGPTITKMQVPRPAGSVFEGVAGQGAVVETQRVHSLTHGLPVAETFVVRPANEPQHAGSEFGVAKDVAVEGKIYSFSQDFPGGEIFVNPANTPRQTGNGFGEGGTATRVEWTHILSDGPHGAETFLRPASTIDEMPAEAAVKIRHDAPQGILVTEPLVLKPSGIPEDLETFGGVEDISPYGAVEGAEVETSGAASFAFRSSETTGGSETVINIPHETSEHNMHVPSGTVEKTEVVLAAGVPKGITEAEIPLHGPFREGKQTQLSAAERDATKTEDGAPQGIIEINSHVTKPFGVGEETETFVLRRTHMPPEGAVDEIEVNLAGGVPSGHFEGESHVFRSLGTVQGTGAVTSISQGLLENDIQAPSKVSKAEEVKWDTRVPQGIFETETNVFHPSGTLKDTERAAGISQQDFQLKINSPIAVENGDVETERDAKGNETVEFHPFRPSVTVEGSETVTSTSKAPFEQDIHPPSTLIDAFDTEGLSKPDSNVFRHLGNVKQMEIPKISEGVFKPEILVATAVVGTEDEQARDQDGLTGSYVFRPSGVEERGTVTSLRHDPFESDIYVPTAVIDPVGQSDDTNTKSIANRGSSIIQSNLGSDIHFPETVIDVAEEQLDDEAAWPILLTRGPSITKIQVPRHAHIDDSEREQMHVVKGIPQDFFETDIHFVLPSRVASETKRSGKDRMQVVPGVAQDFFDAVTPFPFPSGVATEGTSVAKETVVINSLPQGHFQPETQFYDPLRVAITEGAVEETEDMTFIPRGPTITKIHVPVPTVGHDEGKKGETKGGWTYWNTDIPHGHIFDTSHINGPVESVGSGLALSQDLLEPEIHHSLEGIVEEERAGETFVAASRPRKTSEIKSSSPLNEGDAAEQKTTAVEGAISEVLPQAVTVPKERNAEDSDAIYGPLRTESHFIIGVTEGRDPTVVEDTKLPTFLPQKPNVLTEDAEKHDIQKEPLRTESQVPSLTLIPEQDAIVKGIILATSNPQGPSVSTAEAREEMQLPQMAMKAEAHHPTGLPTEDSKVEQTQEDIRMTQRLRISEENFATASGVAAAGGSDKEMQVTKSFDAENHNTSEAEGAVLANGVPGKSGVIQDATEEIQVTQGFLDAGSKTATESATRKEESSIEELKLTSHLLNGGSRLKKLPPIPRLAAEQGASSLLGVWRHALWLQNGDSPTVRTKGEELPRTILSPPWILVLKLAPQDGPHPLYSNTPTNAALRADLILDYLAVPQVKAQDTRITLPQGLTVTNMAGKELLFKSGTKGQLTVNGVDVRRVQSLADGTQVFHLADFLFGHQAKVQQALGAMNNLPSVLTSLNENLYGSDTEFQAVEVPVMEGKLIPRKVTGEGILGAQESVKDDTMLEPMSATVEEVPTALESVRSELFIPVPVSDAESLMPMPFTAGEAPEYQESVVSEVSVPRQVKDKVLVTMPVIKQKVPTIPQEPATNEEMIVPASVNNRDSEMPVTSEDWPVTSEQTATDTETTTVPVSNEELTLSSVVTTEDTADPVPVINMESAQESMAVSNKEVTRQSSSPLSFPVQSPPVQTVPTQSVPIQSPLLESLAVHSHPGHSHVISGNAPPPAPLPSSSSSSTSLPLKSPLLQSLPVHSLPDELEKDSALHSHPPRSSISFSSQVSTSSSISSVSSSSSTSDHFPMSSQSLNNLPSHPHPPSSTSSSSQHLTPASPPPSSSPPSPPPPPSPSLV